MLIAALLLLLVGLPLQLIYSVHLVRKPGQYAPTLFRNAIIGGVCTIGAGAVLQDPLLMIGQAVVLGIYVTTRRSAKALSAAAEEPERTEAQPPQTDRTAKEEEKAPPSA